MKYVKIANDGEIDIHALTLLGASSKAGDETKIGFFGSGNKYALATFLRHGIGVRIFSGAEEFAIETEEINFRGQEFSRIIIGGVHTSLTTRTGPEWELWMAVREFLCNAFDEGGSGWEFTDELSPAADGQTFIFLDCDERIAEIFFNIERITVVGDEPLLSVPTRYGDVHIFDDQNGRVYRKGICCSQQFSSSLFSYSFDEIEINESRIIRYEHQLYERITSALAACEDEEVVARVMAAIIEGNGDEEFLEEKICGGDYWQPSYCAATFSSAWRDWALATKRQFCPAAYVQFLPNEDVGSYLVLPTNFYTKLIRDWDEIPHIGESNANYIAATPTEELVEAVESAWAELQRLELTFGAELEFVYVNFVNEDVVAQQVDGKVLISVNYKPELDYTVMLLEEFVHAETGYGDGSRALQSFLFEKWLAAERK